MTTTTPTRTDMPVTLRMVPLDRLEPHPWNPRREVGDVDELAASIRAIGVLEPVVVAASTDQPDRWVLIAGHRRVRAAEQAGLDEVPAVDRTDLDTAARQLEAALIENGHRADLTPVEEAEGYQQLRLEFGYKPRDIATAMGRPKGYVDRRLALMKLPAPTREKVHGGQLHLGEAEAMVAFAADPASLRQLERAAGGPNFDFTVQRLRQDRERAAALRRAVAAARADGTTVITNPPEGWHWREPGDGRPYAVTRLGDLTAADHAANCEHHVLVPAPGLAELVACCLQPSRHLTGADAERATAGAGGGGAGEREPAPADAEADARAAAARALQQDLAAAAEVRTQFIASLTAPGYRPSAAERATMLRHAIAAFVREDTDRAHEAWAPLGLPPAPTTLDGAEPDPDELADQLLDRVGSWPIERLIQAVYALLVPPFVAAGISRHEWKPGGAYGLQLADHLRHLEQLGYQPCDVETRMLTEAAREAEAATTAGEESA